jgi:hypothetical protein
MVDDRFSSVMETARIARQNDGEYSKIGRMAKLGERGVTGQSRMNKRPSFGDWQGRMAAPLWGRWAAFVGAAPTGRDSPLV